MQELLGVVITLLHDYSCEEIIGSIKFNKANSILKSHLVSTQNSAKSFRSKTYCGGLLGDSLKFTEGLGQKITVATILKRRSSGTTGAQCVSIEICPCARNTIFRVLVITIYIITVDGSRLYFGVLSYNIRFI